MIRYQNTWFNRLLKWIGKDFRINNLSLNTLLISLKGGCMNHPFSPGKALAEQGGQG